MLSVVKSDLFVNMFNLTELRKYKAFLMFKLKAETMHYGINDNLVVNFKNS